MIRVEQDYQEQRKTIDAEGNYTSIEMPYIVFGCDDEDDALNCVYRAIDKELYSLPLESVEIQEKCNNKTYKVNVVYRKEQADSGGGSFSNNESEEPTVSFDCGGGTKHVQYSLSQKTVYGNKDPGGAIGWNGKGGDDCQIAGVDIPTAQLRETYTKVMRLSRLTTSYKRKVAALVGKVNSSSFKGWSAGEVMFLGMSYSSPASGAEKVVVTYNFAVQPNESQVKVGNKRVSKKGFEYVWAISKTVVGSNGAPEMQLEGIYVDQVCEYASFSGLGL